MSKAKQLYDALKKMSAAGADVFPGIVKQVFEDTIEVDVDGLTYYDVRLQSITGSNKGLKLMPKKDSIVLLQRIGNAPSNEFCICLLSEIDEMRCEVASTKLLQNANGFQLSKGTDSLKAILNDLIGEILKIYAPMNTPGITAIQQRVNQLLQ